MTAKTFPFLILALVACSEGQTDKSDSADYTCQDMHAGEFEYTNKAGKMMVIRTDSMQIEKYSYGPEIHSTIEWISDCEYILTYTKFVDFDYETDDIIGRTIRAEIKNIESREFIVYAKGANVDEDITFTKVK